MTTPPLTGPPALRREARDLALVAMGAVPGALTRWRLEAIGKDLVGGLTGVTGADVVANLAGAFVLGLIVARPGQRPRLMLLGGIGFCGSLTTFSGWMLRIAVALQRGQVREAIAVVLVSLLAGLAALGAGLVLGRRWGREQPIRR